MFQFQIKLCFTIRIINTKVCLYLCAFICEMFSVFIYLRVSLFLRVHRWRCLRRWAWNVDSKMPISRFTDFSSEQSSYSLYFVRVCHVEIETEKQKGPPPALCSKTGNFTCFQPARFFESRTKNSTDTFMHPTT